MSSLHDDFSEQQLSRAELKAKRKRQTYRRRRTALLAIITAVVLGGGGIFAATQAQGVWNNVFGNSDDFEGEGHGEVIVQIAEGSSATQVANQLVEAGVVKSSRAFLNEVEARGAVIQAGSFRLRYEMSSAAVLDTLAEAAGAHRVTVAEGLTIESIKERAVEAGISQADIDAAIDDKKPKDYGLDVDAPNLEGYLYPATYDLGADMDAKALVQQMVDKTRVELNELAIPHDDANYYLTLASLVQVEANADPEVQAKVARSFLNRLGDDSQTDGYLQSDATVAYLAGARQDLTTTAEERDIDSPYNTYKYKGLPPGPINSPSKSAVQAAKNPAEGDWQFFVATNPDEGTVEFASNYDDHLKNVEKYREWLRTYRSENPESTADASADG